MQNLERYHLFAQLETNGSVCLYKEGLDFVVSHVHLYSIYFSMLYLCNFETVFGSCNCLSCMNRDLFLTFATVITSQGSLAVLSVQSSSSHTSNPLPQRNWYRISETSLWSYLPASPPVFFMYILYGQVCIGNWSDINVVYTVWENNLLRRNQLAVWSFY